MIKYVFLFLYTCDDCLAKRARCSLTLALPRSPRTSSPVRQVTSPRVLSTSQFNLELCLVHLYGRRRPLHTGAGYAWTSARLSTSSQKAQSTIVHPTRRVTVHLDLPDDRLLGYVNHYFEHPKDSEDVPVGIELWLRKGKCGFTPMRSWVNHTQRMVSFDQVYGCL